MSPSRTLVKTMRPSGIHARPLWPSKRPAPKVSCAGGAAAPAAVAAGAVQMFCTTEP